MKLYTAILLTALSLVTSSAVNARVADENANLRFTKEDGARFQTEAESLLMALTSAIQTARELAIMASNGTLGASDRTFLQTEFASIKNSVQLGIDQAWFRDSFMATYRYLNDGIEFDTLTESGLVRHVRLDALTFNYVGQLASKLFEIHPVIDTTTEALIINGIAIPPTLKTDDTLSSDANDNSSIAWAKVINSKSGQTKVTADVQDTILTLPTPQFASFDGNLSYEDFKLNNVGVTGSKIDSVNALIEAINSVSSSSGIKARLKSGSTEIIEVYSLDGRNIAVQVKDNKLFKEFTPGTSNVTTGSIRLRSARKMVLESKNFISMTIGDSMEVPVQDGGFANADLSTQAYASDALSSLDQVLSQLNTRRMQISFSN